jgi:hypothetical protein
MSDNSNGRWLSDFQLGSIFGSILIGVAFAAALSVAPIRPGSGQQQNYIKESAAVAGGREEEEETLWQWAMKDSTSAFTLGLVMIAAVQAVMFFVQLKYMNKGLVEAADAADAAKNAANAAVQSNNISRELFVAENRPWISVDVSPMQNGTLVIDPFGSISLEILLTYCNHGKSPAINSLIGSVTIISEEDEILSTQDKILQSIRRAKSYGKNDGIVIFPNEIFPSSARAAGSVKPGSFATKLKPSTDTPSNLFIVGACDYAFPSGNSGITRFSFAIGVVRGEANPYFLRPIGPTTPTSKIKLGRSNVGNSAA